LVVCGCNNDTLLPSGNERAENKGALCEPRPASELEDCNVWGEPRVKVDTKEKLRQVCESDCRNIPWLFIFEIPGVTNMEAFENRRILERVSIRNMPDLKSTRGLSIADETEVSFSGNPYLTDLQALESLTRSSVITLRENDLRNLDALSNLEEIVIRDGQSRMSISGTELSDFSGIEGLNVTGDWVEFDRNQNLEALPDLQGTPSSIYINSNPKLTDVSALASFDAIIDELLIRNNESLKRCHIEDVLADVRVLNDARTILNGNSNRPCN
jgi:hypothetical protein